MGRGAAHRNSRAFSFHVSREEQARWLKRTYEIADDKDYVYLLGWFKLLDEPTSVESGLTTGLMTHPGEHKPSFVATGRPSWSPTERRVPSGPPPNMANTVVGFQERAHAHQLYVFAADLVGHPDVQRAIAVRSDQTLVDLHDALQAAFEWDDDHLYSAGAVPELR